MDLILSIVKYAFLGFFGLIIALFVLALLFGKRTKKKWEFDADFLDENGRELGELDIEMSRIEKEEPDYTFKAKLVMRHEALVIDARVNVELDGKPLLAGRVDKAGRIQLGNEHIQTTLGQANTGQVARVLVDDVEIASAELRPD